MNKKILVVGIVVAVFVVAAAAYYNYRHDIQRSVERASLPEPVEYSPTPEAQLPVAEETDEKSVDVSSPASMKNEVNLAVPFTPQAPFANWEPPYKEFCEEASVLMAAKYLKGEDIPSPEAADKDMLAIKAFEEKRFGYYEDTTAAETAVILREHFKITDITLVENPTVSGIKEALAAGRLVIVPAAGRLLGNPYYTPPGPLYHMFVIKGYTKDGRFITNDPGTRRGADFLFSEDAVMNAMHDWRSDGEVTKGKKVIIIVG